MEIKNGDETKKIGKGNKLSQFLRASARALAKVRDFYIRSLTGCSGHLDYGMAFACPTGQVPSTLPKSHSVSSTTSSHGIDDYKELVRAASTRSLSKKIEADFQRQAARKSPMAGSYNMPRSHSVGIGRIDEEKPCEFEEDHVKVNSDAYPRSRSYAIHRRSGVFNQM